MIPENINGIIGPETATAKANILTNNPAFEMVTPKYCDKSGSIPTTPISVFIILNTPNVKIKRIPFEFSFLFI